MSGFLAQIGLANLDLGLVVFIMAIVMLLLIILNICNLRSISKYKKRYNKFMQGKNAKSLENEIVGLFEDNKFIKTSIEKNKKDIRVLYKKMETTFQKIGIVKYDAFNQMGGSLSFCLCLLDENGNGFILNSVHSTEGCYSYSKEIEEGRCKLDLGKEEQEALEKAIGGE